MRVSRESVPSEHVDVVVVGSGFGGSVPAYRLAEGGLSVVVLERGRAYPPGSFARTPAEMSRAVWDPSAGLYGLFDIWAFHGFEAVVSSGLGGGSLIYANVLLRKDEKWFVHEDKLPRGGYENWPVTRAELDSHYDAVETMMGAAPYPLDAPAYRDTPKTVAMRTAAEKLELEWFLPPLAVSFAPERGAVPGLGLPIVEPGYGNYHDLPRRTCRLCGECDLGCNDGAKNTLDHNYLSAARRCGADIRTRCEVRDIRPVEDGGYLVTYVEHDPDAEGRTMDTSRLPCRIISCDRLVLGAGAYGTTFLLLRNRHAFPGLSPALGSRYSGNGDLLTFLLPNHADPAQRRAFAPSHGPVITSTMRIGDAHDGDGSTGRGFYLQDGGYPGFTDWLVESTDLTGTMFRLGEFLTRRLLAVVTRSPNSSLSKEVSRLLGDGSLSAGSLPLLGMGRDIPDGVIRLRGGKLEVEWTTATSEAYFKRIRQTMRSIGQVLDSRFLDNPAWFFRRIVTVHPLGGAPMGHNPIEGVCNAYGEVFGYPGLYVTDGAAMPGPVGANPSLTIAALADRASTHILEGNPRRSARRSGLAAPLTKVRRPTTLAGNPTKAL